MTTTEAKNCQTCGHSPAAWAEGGLILIQCIQPTCASIAIIGGHTLEMAAKAWDAYQTTNKDKSELRATNRALLEQLDEARAAMRTPITPAALFAAGWVYDTGDCAYRHPRIGDHVECEFNLADEPMVSVAGWRVFANSMHDINELVRLLGGVA